MGGMESKQHSRKAWVVTVDMGYGHQRAAHAIEDLAYGDIIVANDYHGIPASDRKIWVETRKLYETVSRFKSVPLIGEMAFEAMDRFQQIEPFYPHRDLSKPNLQLRQLYYFIENKNFGKDLVDRLRKRRMPLITTFFLPAFAAEHFDYPEDIYLVTCDADISRTWVAKDPKRSRIKYFASNGRVVERLKLYGVPPERIFLTGFPLPKALIGGAESEIIKKDLGERICHLDPQRIFSSRYEETLKRTLGPANCRRTPTRPLTVTFAVGGAGAQRDLALVIAESLREKIRRGQVVLNLVAGTKKEVAADFKKRLRSLGLGPDIGEGVKVHLYPDRETEHGMRGATEAWASWLAVAACFTRRPNTRPFKLPTMSTWRLLSRRKERKWTDAPFFQDSAFRIPTSCVCL